jgi:hypothetical protein
MKMHLATLALMSVLTFNTATAAEVTVADVARILINNPLKAISGFPGCNDRLINVTATEVSRGVTSYELTLVPGNFCEPKKATVTIVEDVTATAHDGPKTYKTRLEISPMF